MTSRTRRARSLAAIIVIASFAAPLAARAAVPTINSVVVFGHVKPGDPGYADPIRGGGTVFPTSLPYGRGNRGDAYYIGNATPGSIVDLTVTDGARTLAYSVATAVEDDPEMGITAGDFGVGVDGGGLNNQTSTNKDLNSVQVTTLGVHRADGPPTSPDPADWGPSTLTFTFVARDPGTGETSAPVERTLTKYAGTPGDSRAPVFASGSKYGPQWPPAHWCHLSARGAQRTSTPAFDFGGSKENECSNREVGGMYLPNATFLLCARETSEPTDQAAFLFPILVPNPLGGTLATVNQPLNPVRGQYCASHNDVKREEYVPSGQSNVFSLIDDGSASALGEGSEIADIVIEVTQGPTLLRRFVMDTASDPSTSRFNGTRATYTQVLKINDFEPNMGGVPYLVTVTATDAWGFSTTIKSPNITVYPW